MKIHVWLVFSLFAAGFGGFPAVAEPMHGISMHGTPALGPGFSSLPYANPDAPAGGTVVFGETGTFDTLNPYGTTGNAPWAMRVHVVESLMARSYAEPFALYGLLAESIETPEDRSWVAFTLRPEARFSDGSPVTVEDVIWSFETLGTEGHLRYRKAWESVSAIRQTGPGRLRIDFNEPNRELPLILGLRPVLKKAQFAGRALTDRPMEPPIGSGPYRVERAEAGELMVFRKNPDWWGRDLAVNRGLNNFDEIRYVWYRSASALWEAVRAGQISIQAEYDPVRWAGEYDFEAVTEGRLERGTLTHQRPTGMKGFVLNTRREAFADRRVREAMMLSFDWEWVNSRVHQGHLVRIQSYFGNSPLAHRGAAEGREAAILAPFAADLPPGTLDGAWQPPVTDGSGRNRRNIRKAGQLLEAAGWPVVDGLRRNAEGTALSLQILVSNAEDEAISSLWRDALARLGITVEVRLVDRAQYLLRRRAYDYDVIVNRWAMSLSPGTEQRYYFGASGRTVEGTRNYMGVADPAVEASIDAMLAATDSTDFQAAVRALDRVLTAGLYVIPFGTLPDDRLVWQSGLARPATGHLYGWWGWWGGAALWWAGGN